LVGHRPKSQCSVLVFVEEDRQVDFFSELLRDLSLDLISDWGLGGVVHGI